jgi:hypothetical protein
MHLGWLYPLEARRVGVKRGEVAASGSTSGVARNEALDLDEEEVLKFACGDVV